MNGERTNAGFLADSLGGLGQTLDGLFVVAEALVGAHVGAVLELGGIDTIQSGILVNLVLVIRAIF